MTKDENIWGNVRFAILLVFTVVLIFIILCKFVFDVPIKESSELIKDINHSETIMYNSKVLSLCLKEAGRSVRTAPDFLHTVP